MTVQLFATCSVVAMLLVTSVVGARLLLTARRTHQLPELLFGIGFLGAGVGLGVGQLGTSFLWTEATPFATVMSTALFGLVVAGGVALHGAIWRVFRPHDLWGFSAFAIGSCLALVAYGMRIGGGDFSAGVVASRGMQVFVFALIWVFSWAGIEAIHLYLRLRKQARLGLAKPIAASQIGLWGVAAILSAVMSTVIGLQRPVAPSQPPGRCAQYRNRAGDGVGRKRRHVVRVLPSGRAAIPPRGEHRSLEVGWGQGTRAAPLKRPGPPRGHVP